MTNLITATTKKKHKFPPTGATTTVITSDVVPIDVLKKKRQDIPYHRTKSLRTSYDFTDKDWEENLWTPKSSDTIAIENCPMAKILDKDFYGIKRELVELVIYLLEHYDVQFSGYGALGSNFGDTVFFNVYQNGRIELDGWGWRDIYSQLKGDWNQILNWWEEHQKRDYFTHLKVNISPSSQNSLKLLSVKGSVDGDPSANVCPVIETRNLYKEYDFTTGKVKSDDFIPLWGKTPHDTPRIFSESTSVESRVWEEYWFKGDSEEEFVENCRQLWHLWQFIKGIPTVYEAGFRRGRGAPSLPDNISPIYPGGSDTNFYLTEKGQLLLGDSAALTKKVLQIETDGSTMEQKFLYHLWNTGFKSLVQEFKAISDIKF